MFLKYIESILYILGSFSSTFSVYLIYMTVLGLYDDDGRSYDVNDLESGINCGPHSFPMPQVVFKLSELSI